MKQQCALGLSTAKECTYTYHTCQSYLDLLMLGCITCCSRPSATGPPLWHTVDEWQMCKLHSRRQAVGGFYRRPTI